MSRVLHVQVKSTKDILEAHYMTNKLRSDLFKKGQGVWLRSGPSLLPCSFFNLAFASRTLARRPHLVTTAVFSLRWRGAGVVMRPLDRRRDKRRSRRLRP